MSRSFFRLSLWLVLSLIFAQWGWGHEYRTIDGSNNNLDHYDQGRANTPLVRIRDVIADPLPGFDYDALAPAYEDGIDVPRGMIDPNSPPGVGTWRLPNPRDVSNAVVAQGGDSLPNQLGASDWTWQWGQFIDHDFSLEEPKPTSEAMLIPVSDPNDSLYNPGFPYLPFRRNDPAPGTGAGTSTPREHVNALTAYIDGSNVYGSDQNRADFLRTGENGLLKTTLAANGEVLLPFNRAVDPFPNANAPVRPGDTPPPAEELFLAGDVRANEQVGLTAVHTLFVREHNRLATELAARSDLSLLVAESGRDPSDPADVDEFIYQTSRKAVGAEIQAITYEEFLPLLLGPGALPEYMGYDSEINASISNEFANAAYRVGHTLLSPQIQMVDGQGTHQGSIALRDAFFNPQFVEDHGVELLLNGLAMQQAQSVDAKVIDEVRNFLFAEGNGGLDLTAVNIQRGRDHGLPSYNDARRGLGLEPRTSFSEITSNMEVATALASQYDSVEDVDLWLGAVAEDPVTGGLVGELLRVIIADQFTRTRDGDRFFYLNDEVLWELFPDVGQTRLSDVILRNTSIARMQPNAFLTVPEPATWALWGVALVGSVRLLPASSRRNRR
jgi:hypothetical protein